MSQVVHYVVEHKETLAAIALFLVSELLPFNDNIKANGIFQAIVNLLKKVAGK